MAVTFCPRMSAAMRRTLRTCVGVHIIAGDDMNSHIRSCYFLLPSTLCADSRFAAAVVEQVHICIAKVTICDAIDDVVKARFRQSDPRCEVKHFVGDVIFGRCCDGNCKYNCERQPEQHECEKAVEIATHQ